MQVDIVQYFRTASEDYCVALRFPDGKGFIIFTEAGPALTTREPFEVRHIASTTEIPCELHAKIRAWMELAAEIEGICMPLKSGMIALGMQFRKRHEQSA